MKLFLILPDGQVHPSAVFESELGPYFFPNYLQKVNELVHQWNPSILLIFHIIWILFLRKMKWMIRKFHRLYENEHLFRPIQQHDVRSNLNEPIRGYFWTTNERTLFLYRFENLPKQFIPSDLDCSIPLVSYSSKCDLKRRSFSWLWDVMYSGL